METKKTVVEKYSRELEEIESQLELVKAGESSDIELINQIRALAISAYYDGKREGMQQMYEILKN